MITTADIDELIGLIGQADTAAMRKWGFTHQPDHDLGAISGALAVYVVQVSRALSAANKPGVLVTHAHDQRVSQMSLQLIKFAAEGDWPAMRGSIAGIGTWPEEPQSQLMAFMMCVVMNLLQVQGGTPAPLQNAEEMQSWFTS